VDIEEEEDTTVGYSDPLRNNCMEKIAMESKHNCGRDNAVEGRSGMEENSMKMKKTKDKEKGMSGE